LAMAQTTFDRCVQFICNKLSFKLSAFLFLSLITGSYSIAMLFLSTLFRHKQ